MLKRWLRKQYFVNNLEEGEIVYFSNDSKYFATQKQQIEIVFDMSILWKYAKASYKTRGIYVGHLKNLQKYIFRTEDFTLKTFKNITTKDSPL